eukprot:TRINITY_DN6382_c0_g1_i1.p1 TRINITY_DN6382_c0_g1~~TRINITY_DN6382_c0_g1_i1.p1  ORF type:complete len:153 (+),score=18.03 TRINITY_DN6382_c0_g1_i1:351-809(+)
MSFSHYKRNKKAQVRSHWSRRESFNYCTFRIRTKKKRVVDIKVTRLVRTVDDIRTFVNEKFGRELIKDFSFLVDGQLRTKGMTLLRDGTVLKDRQIIEAYGTLIGGSETSRKSMPHLTDAEESDSEDEEEVDHSMEHIKCKMMIMNLTMSQL